MLANLSYKRATFRVIFPKQVSFSTRFMSALSTKLVLTPVELSELPQETTVPIDVSWFMPNVSRDPNAEFLAKRIPNARRIDLDAVASEHPLGLKHMMPSPAFFAVSCEQIGVSPSSHVVLYDSAGVFSSPRALFMFKAFGHKSASILNGGLPRWEKEGHPIETGLPKPVTPTKYAEPTLNMSFIRGYHEIVQNTTVSASDAEIVLDARSRGRFTGEDPEPRPGLSSGHMPNSRSLPFTELLKSTDGYTVLDSPERRREIVEKVLGPEMKNVFSGERHVVNSCGSGMTAAVLWLALQELGVDTAIYDESWTGYAIRSESTIVKGN